MSHGYHRSMGCDVHCCFKDHELILDVLVYHPDYPRADLLWNKVKNILKINRNKEINFLVRD